MSDRLLKRLEQDIKNLDADGLAQHIATAQSLFTRKTTNQPIKGVRSYADVQQENSTLKAENERLRAENKQMLQDGKALHAEYVKAIDDYNDVVRKSDDPKPFTDEWIGIYQPYNRMMGALLKADQADDITLSIVRTYANAARTKLDAYVQKTRLTQPDYKLNDQLPIFRAIRAADAGDTNALYAIAQEGDQDYVQLYQLVSEASKVIKATDQAANAGGETEAAKRERFINGMIRFGIECAQTEDPNSKNIDALRLLRQGLKHQLSTLDSDAVETYRKIEAILTKPDHAAISRAMKVDPIEWSFPRSYFSR
jgi:hypothetical protein